MSIGKMAKILLFKGKSMETDSDDLDEVIGYLRNQQTAMHSYLVDDLINFLDAVSFHWKNNEAIKKKYGVYINQLTVFMLKDNLKKMLDLSLRGDRKFLDKAIKPKDEDFYLHCQPRGLVVHWIAGNVPLLGIFSLMQSLLTKNTTLVKASSKSYKEFVELIESFSEVRTEKLSGEEILKSIAVVLVDSSDKKNQQRLSENADIRVAWGGREAVVSIINLKKSWWTEDIIYGPKYSYALVDKESLEKVAGEAAKRLAIDVSVFDQYACSSPHTIFIESPSKEKSIEFCKKLAEQLEWVNKRLLPKEKEDSGKEFEIHNCRAEYGIRGEVFASKNTDWTVIYSEEEGLADACFSRVVFVRPIKDIRSIAKLNDRQKQTLGISMELKKRLIFCDDITKNGIDRCVKPGTMTYFEYPWDGIFGIDRMVRWIRIYK